MEDKPLAGPAELRAALGALGPASLMDFGLPGGFQARLLEALSPTADELIAAARWTRTHDPSPGFLKEVSAALRTLGVTDVDL